MSNREESEGRCLECGGVASIWRKAWNTCEECGFSWCMVPVAEPLVGAGMTVRWRPGDSKGPWKDVPFGCLGIFGEVS